MQGLRTSLQIMADTAVALHKAAEAYMTGL